MMVHINSTSCAIQTVLIEVWVLESRLWYYPDGKLRRRGMRPLDLFLQGMDYVYTFDGWLKAINAEVLANDPGRDGFIVGNDTSYYARDVFSLLLRYYPDDYRPIKPGVPLLEASVLSGYQHLFKPYYTGWISSWSLWLDTMHTAYSFRYDQMGRLTRATTLSGFDGSLWNALLVNRYSTRYRYDLVGNILSLVRYDGSGNLLDSLRYDYYDLSLNNRLKSISDAVSTQFPYDLESQPSVNYLYDPVGNMVRDVSRNLTIRYNYANRPRLLTLGNETIRMLYNPAGYRFFKGTADKGDIFIYNMQGQLMAKYSVEGDTLRLDFLPIYEGSRRLGIYEPEGVKWVAGSGRLSLLSHITILPCLNCPMQLTRVRRYSLKPTRKYELTDHLGNVRVVIADQRVPVPDSSGQVVAYYKPKVVGIYDYYPFGWLKPLTMDPYPFTYQGQMLDREVGWQYYRYRNYDPVVGRFWQVEPLVERYAWIGGYVFSEDKVVHGRELEGLEYSPARGGSVVVGDSGMYVVGARDNTAVLTNPMIPSMYSKERDVQSVIDRLAAIDTTSGRVDKEKMQILRRIVDLLWYLDSRLKLRGSNDPVEQSGGVMMTSEVGHGQENRRARFPDEEMVNIDLLLATIGSAIKAGKVQPGEISMLVDALEIGHELRNVIDRYLKLIRVDTDKQREERYVIPVFCAICGLVYEFDILRNEIIGEAPANSKALDTIDGHVQYMRKKSK